MAKEFFEFSDRYRDVKPAPLATNHTLERGKAFLELITRISTKDRAIAQSFVSQFGLYDYNDYKTSQDGIRRHQYHHAVRYLQESGETWQFIVESEKDKRGYSYLSPNKNGNRAFFPAVPSDIRKAIGDRYEVDVPLVGSFWDWLQQNKEIPIIITEGGGKSLAGLSHGFVTIALYGCSCLSSPDLLPYLHGREVYIALDQDTKASAIKAVNTALNKHLKPLSKIANSVTVLRWSNQFKGLDDLLASGGVVDFDSAISADEWLNNYKIAIASARLESSKIKADLVLDRLPTFAELQEILRW
jgi:hypothetical protein